MVCKGDTSALLKLAIQVLGTAVWVNEPARVWSCLAPLPGPMWSSKSNSIDACKQTCHNTCCASPVAAKQTTTSYKEDCCVVLCMMLFKSTMFQVVLLLNVMVFKNSTNSELMMLPSCVNEMWRPVHSNDGSAGNFCA